MTPSTYLKQADHFALPLAAFMLDRYGVEWIEWDPSILQDELEATFAVSIDDSTLDKIQAAATILGTNAFHKLPNVFIPTCILLNRGVVSTDEFAPASVDDMAWGVLEAKLIDPETPSDEFGPDIAAYVGLTLDMRGLLVPPPPLDFAIYPSQPLRVSGQTPMLDAGADEMTTKLAWERTEEVREHLTSKTRELFRELLVVPLTDNRGREAIKDRLERLAVD